VPRPRRLELEHLYRAPYTARIREGIQPISVTEYKGTGATWIYLS
jgi:hypothetical protein